MMMTNCLQSRIITGDLSWDHHSRQCLKILKNFHNEYDCYSVWYKNWCIWISNTIITATSEIWNSDSSTPRQTFMVRLSFYTNSYKYLVQLLLNKRLSLISIWADFTFGILQYLCACNIFAQTNKPTKPNQTKQSFSSISTCNDF